MIESQPRRTRRISIAARLLVVAALVLPARALLAQAAATLTVDEAFVVLGTPAAFTVRGEAGAPYVVYLASAPASIPLGAAGTLYMTPGTFGPIGGGTLDGAGSAVTSFTLPAVPALAGRVLYAQALVLGGAGARLSNSVAVRGQAAPAAGPRAPRAIAVTPDGRRAFVAHQLDGSLSVIDTLSDTAIADLPVGPSAAAVPHRPLDVAVDPEGRHVFVVNVAARALVVIEASSSSVVAALPMPSGSRRVAFDFSVSPKRIYVTNERLNSVLVFAESPPGRFSPLPSIALQGRGPGPIAVLANRLLVVGHRTTLDLELLDPFAAPGAATLRRTTLGRLPYDIAVNGSTLALATFFHQGAGGFNVLARVNPGTLAIEGVSLVNEGTDYYDIDVAAGLVAVAATGSGAAIVANASTGELLDRIDLVAGLSAPNATPQGVAIVSDGAGAPHKLYVVDQFRETVRAVPLAGAAPYAPGTVIALAHSGAERVPLSGELSVEEDGEYLLRSVAFFNADAMSPNPVTCATCHTDLASDNVTRNRQPQPLFGLSESAPYNWLGTGTDLLRLVRGAFNVHGQIGGALGAGRDLAIVAFLDAFEPPRSIHLEPDGSLGSDAAAGKILFEGIAQCTECHAAPTFLPPAPAPLTIAAGVGTGLAPINVPGLRGIWATAPYLHDGSAKTLAEVFTAKPGDVHSQRAQGLTQTEIAQLVAYLRSL